MHAVDAIFDEAARTGGLIDKSLPQLQRRGFKPEELDMIFKA